VKIAFDCASCGEKLEAEASQAGQRVSCPECQAEMTVPFMRVPQPSAKASEDPFAQALRHAAEQTLLLRSIRNWLRFLGWMVILSELAGLLWLLSISLL